MKGLECKYLIKKCSSCKQDKLIHNFTTMCKDCRKEHVTKKYYGEVKSPIHREPVVAVRPSDKVFLEARNMKSLKLDLSSMGVQCRSHSLQMYNSKETKFKRKAVKYWSYKGLIIVFKKDYSPELIEQIFLERLTRKSNPRKDYERNVSEEMKIKIATVLTLRKSSKLKAEDIAERVGLSRSNVNHILTGRTYSRITGITYKRAYNKYSQDGDVMIPKERYKTVVSKL